MVIGHESGPIFHHLQVGFCEGLAHEGEGFGAAEVVYYFQHQNPGQVWKR
jgi:hypothetical protein